MLSANDPAVTQGSISHLIIVCCHAIWLGGPSFGMKEGEWSIEPFQAGETVTFLEHIRAGLETLEKQPNSLLVFSGAATKGKYGIPLAEGESYLDLADRISGFTHMIAECQATDSYQNILFSLLHFRRLTLRYPTSITIISHAFKEPRFTELHIPAMRFPKDRVKYIGIDPSEHVTSQESLIRGEQVRGYGVWQGDLYGIGEVLSGKRRERGWDDETLAMVGDSLEDGVMELLKWKGGESGVEIYRGKLPWATG